MAVANHALSCHHHGPLIQVPETPTTSKCTVLQRTGLPALPRQKRRSYRIHAAAKPSTSLLDSTSALDVDGILAEAPSLLALSSDLDWQRSVSELRQEAKRGAPAVREVAMERLGADFQQWMRDTMFDAILQNNGTQYYSQPEDAGVQIRVEELRWQAALQAAEELARGVDSSFDWESEAAEMRQCVMKQERCDLKRKLMKSWESARDDMDKDAVALHNEALNMNHQDDSYPTLSSEKQQQATEHHFLDRSVSWWTLGVTMATGWVNTQAMDAIAAEPGSAPAVAEAVVRSAPEWVAPTVLATPVVSYLLFTWYRNTVNPYAKLTDWVFGLITLVIVGNIVLIKTIGVRLY